MSFGRKDMKRRIRKREKHKGEKRRKTKGRIESFQLIICEWGKNKAKNLHQ
jgi:hypothetical protein